MDCEVEQQLYGHAVSDTLAIMSSPRLDTALNCSGRRPRTDVVTCKAAENSLNPSDAGMEVDHIQVQMTRVA